MSQPVYEHDCSSCTFYGHIMGHDLYGCGRTFIARRSSDGPDYMSMDIELLEQAVNIHYPRFIKQFEDKGQPRQAQGYRDKLELCKVGLIIMHLVHLNQSEAVG